MDPLAGRFEGSPTKDKSFTSCLSLSWDPANMILVHRNREAIYFVIKVKDF